MISLASAIFCFIEKKAIAGFGFLLIALALGFSFLIAIKSLEVDLIGPTLTIVFAVGCVMIVDEIRRHP
jgi:urea transporter